MVGFSQACRSPVVNDLIAWPLVLWQQHKAMQGTDRRLHMNVGEGVDVSVEEDANEPA